MFLSNFILPLISSFSSLFSSADQFPASYMTAGGGGLCFELRWTSSFRPTNFIYGLSDFQKETELGFDIGVK